MTDDWQAQLSAAVARGLDLVGLDAVAAALADQVQALAEHPDAPVEVLRPDRPVLGVVACESGRLGVLLQLDGRVSVHVARSVETLLELVVETTEPGVVVEAESGSEGAPAADRRELLRRAGLVVPGWYSGSGFSEGDLLDACTAVLSALSP
ncbi:MAG: hydrolase [Marmoricola sp.]|nr:hydrolase [Marmoricola sp.]